jgi:hypothetical protein
MNAATFTVLSSSATWHHGFLFATIVVECEDSFYVCEVKQTMGIQEIATREQHGCKIHARSSDGRAYWLSAAVVSTVEGETFSGTLTDRHANDPSMPESWVAAMKAAIAAELD